jgi:hypothetical protein
MEVSGHLHPPAALLQRKEAPGTHWIGGWVGPRAGLDDVEKGKFIFPVLDSKANPSVLPIAWSLYDSVIKGRVLFVLMHHCMKMYGVAEIWLHAF